MKIGNARIGDGVYVIAELGVNHDGQLDRAIELVDHAADAGADAVKLQYFQTDRLMSSSAKLAAYQRAAGERDPISMLRRLELSPREMAHVINRARARNIHAIVTVFSTELIESAETMGWDAYKTASPDVVHKPLLEALAQTDRPLIISTGAAELDEVRNAVSWLSLLRYNRPDTVAFLQCVSCYPTKPEDAAIGAMADLSRVFSGPIGYSDHTPTIDSGGLAVALGAVILEKHLTFSRSAVGPDHSASLEPSDMAEYVRIARLAAARRGNLAQIGEASPLASSQADPRIGDGLKRVQACERDVRSVSRQSVVTRRSLPAGHVLGSTDVTIKRPGTGVPAQSLEDIIGRKLVHSLDADVVLTWSDLGSPAPDDTRCGS